MPYRREKTGSGSKLMVIPASGAKVGRVGMFRGCIMDVMFASTNVNTVRLLRQAGFEIVIPEEQVCCGALHAHAGEMDDAKQLAGQNIWALGKRTWITLQAMRGLRRPAEGIRSSDA